jgi:hypothetical protein
MFVQILLDRGFAFAQEAGQAPHITDNLFNQSMKKGIISLLNKASSSKK